MDMTDLEFDTDLPYAGADSDGKDDFTEGKEQELDIDPVPETKSVKEILQSERSFWDKSKDTIRDTWLGRNTVGRIGGLVLDIGGLAFPRLDSIRRKGKKALHLDQRQFKYQPNSNNMNWVINRLQERSTWRGIITAITAVGVSLQPDQVQAIVGLGVAAFTAIEVFMKEPKSQDAT